MRYLLVSLAIATGVAALALCVLLRMEFRDVATRGTATVEDGGLLQLVIAQGGESGSASSEDVAGRILLRIYAIGVGGVALIVVGALAMLIDVSGKAGGGESPPEQGAPRRLLLGTVRRRRLLFGGPRFVVAVSGKRQDGRDEAWPSVRTTSARQSETGERLSVSVTVHEEHGLVPGAPLSAARRAVSVVES